MGELPNTQLKPKKGIGESASGKMISHCLYKKVVFFF